jgi:phytoene dehydrogenase-like protein
VIANIDPRQVFGEMMDPAESPTGYRRRLDWLTPSDKSISISFVTDLDLPLMGFAFENLIFDSWNEDRVERNPFKGQAGFTLLVITTTIDHGLAPTGQHMVSVFAGLPIEAPLGPIDLCRYGEVVMSMVFRLIPKLDGHLLLANQGSVVEGYLTQPFGSIYGWKASPWQATLRRPNLQTPVRGLILAGQWTRPIQGVMSAVLSGSEAARIVLEGL